jgi:hypothetical protein
MYKQIPGVALAIALLAGTAAAHHPPLSLGTVTITQPVMVGGSVLQPGTYEIRDNGEHGTPLPGQSPDAQAQIEFIADGLVVARDLAEVMPAADRPVGTSGTAAPRPLVQMLRGGEFMRVSVTHEGNRYLIHLPRTGQ